MNGHPRARMKLILRLCENPVKIYNSRPFPALNYSLKWSNIAGQGSNMKNVQKIKIKKNKLEFSWKQKSGCEKEFRTYFSNNFGCNIVKY